MQYRLLGRTGLKVSRISFGASSLSSVFHTVDEAEAVKAVHAALDAGINYFDVAPAYGGTVSETVLGKALKGIPRSRYFLSTKVGKYTDPDKYGNDLLDYSEARIRQSLQESAIRLGTDYFDIIHIHDIEYQNRKHTDWALSEGLDTVNALKKEGRIGSVSFGIYPLDLWHRIFKDYDIDAALVHNHYCLNDTSLLALLPIAKEKGIGIINASPFGSGLLTERGPADWHPAGRDDREIFLQAASLCKQYETSISKLAIQFSSQHEDIPTTMFSSSNPESVLRNIQWSEEALDRELLGKVQEVLSPVMNKQWNY
ncbi:MAG TPA: aldo/keto reductase [Chitinophagaceae bacterium]|nr:aldo/keto reductase [Chitinophagaceae bacterium]